MPNPPAGASLKASTADAKIRSPEARRPKLMHPLETGFDSLCTRSLHGANEIFSKLRECPVITLNVASLEA